MYNVRLLDLHRITSTERTSLGYLCNKMAVSCPRCYCKKYYILTKGKLRCGECRADYNPLGHTNF